MLKIRLEIQSFQPTQPATRGAIKYVVNLTLVNVFSLSHQISVNNFVQVSTVDLGNVVLLLTETHHHHLYLEDEDRLTFDLIAYLLCSHLSPIIVLIILYVDVHICLYINMYV